MHKTKYRFSHRSDDGLFYIWKSTLPVSPGDSRHEIVSTAVAPFWSSAIPSTEQPA